MISLLFSLSNCFINENYRFPIYYGHHYALNNFNENPSEKTRTIIIEGKDNPIINLYQRERYGLRIRTPILAHLDYRKNREIE